MSLQPLSRVHVRDKPEKHAINAESLGKAAKTMQVLTHSALAPCPWSPAPPSYLSSAIQPVQCHPLSTPLTAAWAPSSFYTCPAVGTGAETMHRNRP